MTIFKSPHFTPEFPVQSLPSFLLSPSESSISATFNLSSSSPTKSTPIFYPPPKGLGDEAREQPLSHNDVRTQAYAFAAALSSGKLTGSKWERGDVLVLSSANQVRSLFLIESHIDQSRIPPFWPTFLPSLLSMIISFPFSESSWSAEFPLFATLPTNLLS